MGRDDIHANIESAKAARASGDDEAFAAAILALVQGAIVDLHRIARAVDAIKGGEQPQDG